jgi:hypothetical protein
VQRFHFVRIFAQESADVHEKVGKDMARIACPKAARFSQGIGRRAVPVFIPAE